MLLFSAIVAFFSLRFNKPSINISLLSIVRFRSLFVIVRRAHVKQKRIKHIFHSFCWILIFFRTFYHIFIWFHNLSNSNMKFYCLSSKEWWYVASSHEKNGKCAGFHLLELACFIFCTFCFVSHLITQLTLLVHFSCSRFGKSLRMIVSESALLFVLLGVDWFRRLRTDSGDRAMSF